MEEYLQKQDWKGITGEKKDRLDPPISTKEIQKAIDQMKSGKVPGPDGITAKFYKVFKEDLFFF